MYYCATNLRVIIHKEKDPSDFLKMAPMSSYKYLKMAGWIEGYKGKKILYVPRILRNSKPFILKFIYREPRGEI